MEDHHHHPPGKRGDAADVVLTEQDKYVSLLLWLFGWFVSEISTVACECVYDVSMLYLTMVIRRKLCNESARSGPVHLMCYLG